MAMSKAEAMEYIDKIANGCSLKNLFDRNVKRLFYDCVNRDAELTAAYTRAQQAKAETLADEIIDIADTEPDPQRARVMVDARRWWASKIMPQKYGERMELNITQTLDIAGALQDAKNRIINTTCQQIADVSMQLPEITHELQTSTKGSEPVDVALDTDDQDIFS